MIESGGQRAAKTKEAIEKALTHCLFVTQHMSLITPKNKAATLQLDHFSLVSFTQLIKGGRSRRCSTYILARRAASETAATAEFVYRTKGPLPSVDAAGAVSRWMLTRWYSGARRRSAPSTAALAIVWTRRSMSDAVTGCVQLLASKPHAAGAACSRHAETCVLACRWSAC
jgi:hypothetical protein